MIINVIGLGHVGLAIATLFASKGMQVIGVDVNQNIITKLNQGNFFFNEPGLNEILKSVIECGNFQAFTTPRSADVFIIAVPTPICSDKKPDLTSFENALNSIAPFLKKGNLVVIESTIPIDSINKSVKLLSQVRPDLNFSSEDEQQNDIAIAYCPERVLPGKTLSELIKLDRIIGGLKKTCGLYAAEVYRIFCEGNLFITNARTAEMVKLAENAYRDVNIAFANELSMLCDAHHIDVLEVIALANQHPRVNILKPGPGVGGHCIPVDPWFLVDSCPEKARLIQTARKVNDAKITYVYEKILNEIDRNENSCIAILGLAYKGDVDDTRESPAVQIILQLLKIKTVSLFVTDPNVTQLPYLLNNQPNLFLVSLNDAIQNASVIAILARHKEYHDLLENFDLRNKSLIDATGITHKFDQKYSVYRDL